MSCYVSNPVLSHATPKVHLLVCLSVKPTTTRWEGLMSTLGNEGKRRATKPASCYGEVLIEILPKVATHKGQGEDKSRETSRQVVVTVVQVWGLAGVGGTPARQQAPAARQVVSRYARQRARRLECWSSSRAERQNAAHAPAGHGSAAAAMVIAEVRHARSRAWQQTQEPNAARRTRESAHTRHHITICRQRRPGVRKNNITRCGSAQ